MSLSRRARVLYVGGLMLVALAGSSTALAAPRDTSPATTPGTSPSPAGDIATVATQVAELEKERTEADRRLADLQLALSRAVGAERDAADELEAATRAAHEASAALDAARSEQSAAARILSNTAAMMWMQHTDTSSLGMLVTAPPGAQNDLAFVLDGKGREVDAGLETATRATTDAAARAVELRIAQEELSAAADHAAEARASAEAAASEASAEAEKLARDVEELNARLTTLRANVDLTSQTDRAAALGGSAPRVGVGTSAAAAQQIARSMVSARGWDGSQFQCLVELWHRESGWSWSATNPSSGAYGIPQALPGRKMASAGSDWLTNPATQIRWGLDYIEGRYATPCGAWNAFLSRSPHWY